MASRAQRANSRQTNRAAKEAASQPASRLRARVVTNLHFPRPNSHSFPGSRFFPRAPARAPSTTPGPCFVNPVFLVQSASCARVWSTRGKRRGLPFFWTLNKNLSFENSYSRTVTLDGELAVPRKRREHDGSREGNEKVFPTPYVLRSSSNTSGRKSSNRGNTGSHRSRIFNSAWSFSTRRHKFHSWKTLMLASLRRITCRFEARFLCE